MRDRVKRAPSATTWVGRVMVRPARRTDAPARWTTVPGADVARRRSRLVSTVTGVRCSLGGNGGCGS